MLQESWTKIQLRFYGLGFIIFVYLFNEFLGMRSNQNTLKPHEVLLNLTTKHTGENIMPFIFVDILYTSVAKVMEI